MCDLPVNKLDHIQQLWISWQKSNVKKKKKSSTFPREEKTHTGYPRISVHFLIKMCIWLNI